MVKTSFEETYPWNDSNRWAVTLSVDTMKWVVKAWDEGLVEAESDLESLKSENITLKGIKETLEDDNSKAVVGSQLGICTILRSRQAFERGDRTKRGPNLS